MVHKRVGDGGGKEERGRTPNRRLDDTNMIDRERTCIVMDGVRNTCHSSSILRHLVEQVEAQPFPTYRDGLVAVLKPTKSDTKISVSNFESQH